MKILGLILVFTFSMNVISSQLDTFQLTCGHFAASKIIDTMKIAYIKNDSQWSRVTVIEIKSSEESIIKSDDYVGRLADDITNHYIPTESIVLFEPLKGADYDQAKIRYTHDDDLGTLAVMEYISDGPVFTQILKCR